METTPRETLPPPDPLLMSSRATPATGRHFRPWRSVSLWIWGLAIIVPTIQKTIFAAPTTNYDSGRRFGNALMQSTVNAVAWFIIPYLALCVLWVGIRYGHLSAQQTRIANVIAFAVFLVLLAIFHAIFPPLT